MTYSKCVADVCFCGAGVRVLLVDQWIETGGTMKAAIQLVEKLGATVVGQSPDVTLSLLIISKKKKKKHK